MTDWVPWFRDQLGASTSMFTWAVTQIDPSLHFEQPPPASASYLGDWPPARHVWHLAYYERCIAVPWLRACTGGPPVSDDPCPDWDHWDAFSGRAVDEYVADFLAIRAEQLALLEELADVDWTTPRATGWGQRPLSMIVTKTLQHALEHTDTLLRMSMWWPA